MLPYKTIILDCDGVIFDSNSLKTDAFREVVKEYPNDLVETFISYHKANGGVSRYVKFQYFQEELLGQKPDEKILAGMLSDFGKACRKLYLKAPFTPGCPDILEKWSQNHPLFVASGSDEEELRDVFQKRGIADYFSAIYGSPKTKATCIEEILQSLPGESNAVMIGDATTDWEAAKANNIDFIYMEQFSQSQKKMAELAKIHGFPVVENLIKIADELLSC